MNDEKFTERMEQLLSLGFTFDRTGLTNGKYALLFHQIDEAREDSWNSFINKILDDEVKV
jgi:hypothetical protein